MIKKFNRFKNLRLDLEDQALSDSIERGEFTVEPISKSESKRLSDIAKYTLALEKKDARLNIRMKHSDLRAIRSKASVNGLPYQTLIAMLLHHFAIGKVNIQLK